MTSDLVEAAAEQLRTAADTGVPCAPVREVLGTSTDTDAAYAVQQRNVALAVARRPALSASSSSSTTRRCCDTSATRSWRAATRRP